MRRTAWCAALVLCACSEDESPAPATVTPPPVARLAVQAPPSTESRLASAFEAYTAATGIELDLLYRERAPGPGGHQAPADLLVIDGAGAAGSAAEDGALRPVAGDVAAATVPPVLRDPDGNWLAVAWRPVVLAYDVRQFRTAPPADYAGLADPAFAGKLCLTSFGSGGNAAVVAALIDELGVRPAERVVRGWLANLAAPLFAADAELQSAIGAGQCAAGLVTRPDDEEQGDPAGVLRYVTPEAPAGEILAAGVARHAAEPGLALGLLAWLASEAPLPHAARDAARLPARHLAVTGTYHEDARKLAERAGYR